MPGVTFFWDFFIFLRVNDYSTGRNTKGFQSAILGLLGDASGLVRRKTELAGHVVIIGQAVQEEAGKTNTRVGPALGIRGHTGVGEDGLKGEWNRGR